MERNRAVLSSIDFGRELTTSQCVIRQSLANCFDEVLSSMASSPVGSWNKRPSTVMCLPEMLRRESPVRTVSPGFSARTSTGFSDVPSAWIWSRASFQVPLARISESPGLSFPDAASNPATLETKWSAANEKEGRCVANIPRNRVGTKKVRIARGI